MALKRIILLLAFILTFSTTIENTYARSNTEVEENVEIKQTTKKKKKKKKKKTGVRVNEIQNPQDALKDNLGISPVLINLKDENVIRYDQEKGIIESDNYDINFNPQTGRVLKIQMKPTANINLGPSPFLNQGIDKNTDRKRESSLEDYLISSGLLYEDYGILKENRSKDFYSVSYYKMDKTLKNYVNPIEIEFDFDPETAKGITYYVTSDKKDDIPEEFYSYSMQGQDYQRLIKRAIEKQNVDLGYYKLFEPSDRRIINVDKVLNSPLERSEEYPTLVVDIKAQNKTNQEAVITYDVINEIVVKVTNLKVKDLNKKENNIEFEENSKEENEEEEEVENTNPAFNTPEKEQKTGILDKIKNFFKKIFDKQ